MGLILRQIGQPDHRRSRSLAQQNESVAAWVFLRYSELFPAHQTQQPHNVLDLLPDKRRSTRHAPIVLPCSGWSADPVEENIITQD